MFNTTAQTQPPLTTPSQKDETVSKNSKYKTIIHSQNAYSDEMNYSAIDQLLENEKIHNKTETWNKLDKTVKTQKLHGFAEKYGKEHTLPNKDVKSLKMFFSDCLNKNKLQKAKDVVYDKEHSTITSIPALLFNVTNRNFTLKIIDAKRVSTIKSLTPKRATEKNKVELQEPAESMSSSVSLPAVLPSLLSTSNL